MFGLKLMNTFWTDKDERLKRRIIRSVKDTDETVFDYHFKLRTDLVLNRYSVQHQLSLILDSLEQFIIVSKGCVDTLQKVLQLKADISDSSCMTQIFVWYNKTIDVSKALLIKNDSNEGLLSFKEAIIKFLKTCFTLIKKLRRTYTVKVAYNEILLMRGVCI